MLSIRLSRRGKKGQPTYRLIILEKAKDPWGDYLEDLGYYDPKTKEINFKAERIKYWLEHGAQASDTVHNLLIKQGIIEGDKVKAVKISKKRAEKMKKEAEGKKAQEISKDKTTESVQDKPTEPIQD
ncbi:MAG: 30S ribosomal protein S16, partial [Candidatus Aenigmarchaeota archaeon]|nr:30S ribosomal protein S16 [Candidatus Aenigmarchaeota archaeon]